MKNSGVLRLEIARLRVQLAVNRSPSLGSKTLEQCIAECNQLRADIEKREATIASIREHIEDIDKERRLHIRDKEKSDAYLVQITARRRAMEQIHIELPALRSKHSRLKRIIENQPDIPKLWMQELHLDHAELYQLAVEKRGIPSLVDLEEHGFIPMLNEHFFKMDIDEFMRGKCEVMCDVLQTTPDDPRIVFHCQVLASYARFSFQRNQCAPTLKQVIDNVCVMKTKQQNAWFWGEIMKK